MLELQDAADDWASVNGQQNFQPRKLRITKENKNIYLTVVWILCIIVFISMIGIICFSFLKLNVPDAFIALNLVAVDALGNLFNIRNRNNFFN